MAGEIIQYQTEGGATVIRLQARDGNVWLSQADMAGLFQATKQNISLPMIMAVGFRVRSLHGSQFPRCHAA